MKDLEQLCLNSLKVVDEVADFIRGELGKVASRQIEEKSLNSLVSYVDKTAEEQLVKGLQHLLPDSVFLTEEETVVPAEGDFRWIIDPLDGTTNFLHGLPNFAVSVALERNGEIVLGIVQEVNRREQFYAWEGGQAQLNGRPIEVSPTPKLPDSLVATGFPYFDFEQHEPYLKVLAHFMQNTRGIRRWGAAAVDLVYVACGRFEGFYEYNLNPWDVAAGAFIVQAAGGQVTDFKGGADYIYGRQMLATNGHVHAAMLEPIQQYMNR